MSLTDAEFRILDEMYFVTSYTEILQNSGMGTEELTQVLIGLLEKRYVVQMKYSEAIHDFIRLDIPEVSSFSESSFVATKDGLLIHNSRT